MIEGPRVSMTAAGLPLLEWVQRAIIVKPKEGLWVWPVTIGCFVLAGIVAFSLDEGRSPLPAGMYYLPADAVRHSSLLSRLVLWYFGGVLLMGAALLIYFARRKLTEKQNHFNFAYVDRDFVAVRMHAEALLEVRAGRHWLRCATAFDPRSKVPDKGRDWYVVEADAIQGFAIDNATSWGEQHPGLHTVTHVILADCGNGIAYPVARHWGGAGSLAALRLAMQQAFIDRRPPRGWDAPATGPLPADFDPS